MLNTAGDATAGLLKGEIERQLATPKDLRDFLDRIPITGGDGDAEKLLGLAEITDRFHLPAIDAKHEAAFDGDDLEKPVFPGRQT